MSNPLRSVVHLFSDIEGSTRLWEQQPESMRAALAQHDALCRTTIGRHGGTVVKMTGDGVHAAFGAASAALAGALELQLALAEPVLPGPVQLKVRIGLHVGADEHRDGDYFGPAVNRAARVMSAAHGGQILLSQAVLEQLDGRLPAAVELRELGNVRLRDLASPERLYQVVHPRLRAEFPALRSLEGIPNNLPQQLNSFVGRERELAEVRALLARHRLVTLLGMGGMGKSRLSVQLGAEVLDDHPDGVWLVELAALNDPRLVPQAVATVLGVKEDAGGSVFDALIRFARDRRLLIILDNCEHMIQACADLARQLLQSSAHVKLLASSRDYVGVAGEMTYQLQPLPAPGPDSRLGPEALTRHAAVQLFIERTIAGRPDFRLSERNAAAVATICSRLDGIPLALEIAAARARALPVEDIAARLHDRFRLLVSGDRTVLPRQRTLRALIDWSYDLLSAEEKRLFERLSVFAGSWSIDSAEHVCAGAPLEHGELLDLLVQLVEKSLVVVNVEQGRYRMLDTVRHYAQERLAEHEPDSPCRPAFFEHFLHVAETGRQDLGGPAQAEALARLDRERENLLAAHEIAGTSGLPAAQGLRLVMALRPYWLSRGALSVALRMAEDLLQRTDAELRDDTRARALAVCGQVCLFLGRYGEAVRFLTESLAIAREHGNARRIASFLQPLGLAALGGGQIEAARAYLEEALILARTQGNPRETAAALNALAQALRLGGRLDPVETLYREALQLARSSEDHDSAAVTLINLAMVLTQRGELAAARRHLDEGLKLGEQLASRALDQAVLDACAGLAAACGDRQLALHFIAGAEALADQTRLRRPPADQAFLAPLLAAIAERAAGALPAPGDEADGAAAVADVLAAARRWVAGATVDQRSFMMIGSSGGSDLPASSSTRMV